MSFFRRKAQQAILRTDSDAYYRQHGFTGTRPTVEQEVLTPDIVLTFMDAADARGEQFSLDLIYRSLEATRKRGNVVRAKVIIKHLRWLAKEAEKDGIHWEVVP